MNLKNIIIVNTKDENFVRRLNDSNEFELDFGMDENGNFNNIRFKLKYITVNNPISLFLMRYGKHIMN